MVSCTELHEILKFPDLLEHYKTHKQKDQKISFFDFIAMHYSDANDDDGDSDQDMKLPFKSHNTGFSLNESPFIPHSGTYCLQAPEIKLTKTAFTQSQFTPSAFKATIWQPPKSC